MREKKGVGGGRGGGSRRRVGTREKTRSREKGTREEGISFIVSRKAFPFSLFARQPNIFPASCYIPVIPFPLPRVTTPFALLSSLSTFFPSILVLLRSLSQSPVSERSAGLASEPQKEPLKRAAPESSRKHLLQSIHPGGKGEAREDESLEVVLTRAAGRYKPLQLASSFSPRTSFAFASRLLGFLFSRGSRTASTC